jgi:hypothetical protein
VEVSSGGTSPDRLGSGRLQEGFLRACTTASDTVTTDEGEGSSEVASAASEVCRATREVIRARDATHSAIALRRADSAGESETRKPVKDAQGVLSGMGMHLREHEGEFGHSPTLSRCRRVAGETHPTRTSLSQPLQAPPAACRACPNPGGRLATELHGLLVSHATKIIRETAGQTACRLDLS